MPITPDRLARIQRFSTILKTILTIVLPLLPLVAGIGWAIVPDIQIGQAIGIMMVGDSHPGPLTTLDRVAGFATSLVPLSVIMYGVWNLRELFSLYAAGQILGPQNATLLRALAMTLIAWVPAQALGDILVSLALSIDNAVGERFVAITMSSNDIAIALIGMVALVISWVMVEAARAAEDSASIV